MSDLLMIIPFLFTIVLGYWAAFRMECFIRKYREYGRKE